MKPFRTLLLFIILFLSFIRTDSITAVQIETPPPPSNTMRFKHYTDVDGVPHPVIQDIFQDQRGFIWVATGDGLARFDGNAFKIYKRDPDNLDNSLSSNAIITLYETRDNLLWIGTRAGIDRLDQQLETITHYHYDPANDNSLSHDVISRNGFYEDAMGNLWVGTWGGLNKLDVQTAVFTRYQHDPADPASLGNDVINTIYPAGNGLWIGTANGLDYFDFTTEQFTHYRQDDTDPNSLGGDVIQSLYVSPDGNVVWIGTTNGLDRLTMDNGIPPRPEDAQFTHYRRDEQSAQSLSANGVLDISSDGRGGLWLGLSDGGLNHFDPKLEVFTEFQPIEGDPSSLSGNSVFSVFQDRDGGLWVGAGGGWLNYYHPTAQKFELYRNNPVDPASLSHNSAAGIYISKNEEVWIATWGGGLNKFDPNSGTFTRFQYDPDDPNSLSSNDTFSVYEDSRGDLWITTIGGGVNRFNRESGTFTRFQNNPNDSNSLSNNVTRWVTEDSNGRLWIATLAGGISIFDPISEQFTTYQYDPNDPQSLCSNQVWSILQDSAGDMWATTVGCLNKFNPETETFKRYLYDPDDPTSLSGDTPIQLFEDSTNRLWITSNDGLNLFDRERETFTHYTKNNGLPSNRVTSIIEDDAGMLWLGTSLGLSRFDPSAETFRNYDMGDGLQGDLFLYPAAAKAADGTLYFGGSSGMNTVHPDQLADNTTPPPVALTDFQLFNKPVPIGDGSPLSKQIGFLDEITLSYDESDIRFETAVLNYASPEKNKIAYFLEGYDPEWIEAGNQNQTIRYTNLDAGAYTLRVKAANNDGIWNEDGVALSIIVKPAWWETWWVQLLALLFVVGTATGGYRWRVQSIAKRNVQLEQMIVNRTDELLEQKQLVAAEEERRRIARDLHDSLTQSVHSLGLTANTAKYMLRKKQYEALSASLDLISDSAQQAYREMRLILYELRVTADEQANLIDVLQTRVERVEQHAGISTEFQLIGLIGGNDIPKSHEIALFYIITEALNNALKHAEANHIAVLIQATPQRIMAKISDDGGGFPEPFDGILAIEQLNYAGMGLQSIVERTMQLGGTARLKTAPSLGTEIIIILYC